MIIVHRQTEIQTKPDLSPHIKDEEKWVLHLHFLCLESAAVRTIAKCVEDITRWGDLQDLWFTYAFSLWHFKTKASDVHQSCFLCLPGISSKRPCPCHYLGSWFGGERGSCRKCSWSSGLFLDEEERWTILWFCEGHWLFSYSGSITVTKSGNCWYLPEQKPMTALNTFSLNHVKSKFEYQ